MADKQERIRRRAYEIWEREGRLDGHHEHNWEEARREIEAEDAAGGALEVISEGRGDSAVAGEPDGEAVRKKPAAIRARRDTATPSSQVKRSPRQRLAETKP